MPASAWGSYGLSCCFGLCSPGVLAPQEALVWGQDLVGLGCRLCSGLTGEVLLLTMWQPSGEGAEAGTPRWALRPEARRGFCLRTKRHRQGSDDLSPGSRLSRPL